MTRGDDSSGQTALSGSAARKARLGSREALSEARELLARELDEVRERERATRSELEAEVDDLRVQVSQLTRRLQETLQGLAESQSEQAILAQDLSERQELVLELERAQEKLGQALQQEQDRSEELLSALEHARLDGEEALRTGQGEAESKLSTLQRALRDERRRAAAERKSSAAALSLALARLKDQSARAARAEAHDSGHIRAAQDYRAAEARLRAKLEQFESEVKALKQKSRNAPEARDSDASTFHAEVSPGSALDAASHQHRQSRRHEQVNNSLAPNFEAPGQQEAFERFDEVKDSDSTDPEASSNFEIDASVEPNLGRHRTQKSHRKQEDEPPRRARPRAHERKTSHSTLLGKEIPRPSERQGTSYAQLLRAAEERCARLEAKLAKAERETATMRSDAEAFRRGEVEELSSRDAVITELRGRVRSLEGKVQRRDATIRSQASLIRKLDAKLDSIIASPVSKPRSASAVKKAGRQVYALDCA